MCWRPRTDKVRQAGQPVKLYLVGHGPYSEALAAMLPDAIFLGYLSGEPLAKAYASADIFVFPSTTDTFGNVVIEAQASGLPVIVSDLGGPRELVEDGISGLITKSRDAEDVARAITLLVSDRELRARMGEKARQSVVDRSWPDAFRKFWHTTESIVDRNAPLKGAFLHEQITPLAAMPARRRWRGRQRRKSATAQTSYSAPNCRRNNSLKASNHTNAGRNTTELT